MGQVWEYDSLNDWIADCAELRSDVSIWCGEDGRFYVTGEWLGSEAPKKVVLQKIRATRNTGDF